MRRLRRWIMRFGGLFNKGRKDRELQDELESHIQMHMEDNLRSGMTPDEARRQAMIQMGGIEPTKEAYREQRGLPLLETLWQDARFGLRMLLKNPGFSVVAILTLALGIGATTAIFSAVYGVLINPYPYGHPGEIWAPAVKTAQESSPMRPYRQDEFEAIAKVPEFSTTMGTWPETALLTGEFAPQTIVAPRLSLNAFQFLEVPPILGRVFGPGDMGPGGQPQPVTVISYRLWQHLMGGDPKALGRVLRWMTSCTPLSA